MKNKKGMTVVELIVSFSLVLVIAVFLFQLVLNLKKLYDNSIVKTELLNKQSIISNEINKKFRSKTISSTTSCGTNCYQFNYTDNSNDKLVVDYDNNTIEFGTYKTELPKDSYLKNVTVDVVKTATLQSYVDGSILIVDIPIYNDNFKDQNFGIRVLSQFAFDNALPEVTLVYNFDYTGSYQTFVVPETGRYKLEVWGAQGGNHSANAHGGYGGYSYGTINLSKGTTIYIYVGSQGQSVNVVSTYSSYAFGGGGRSYTGSQSGVACAGGGGASDIRISQNSLYSRVLVAGGGGGACAWSSESSYSTIGGAGGGTSGGPATTYKGSGQSNGTGGSISSPGTTGTITALSGSFGQGGSASSSSGGGGGGGWYGGSAGRTNGAGGGGGSGYVYNSSTYTYCPTGCTLNSSYYLTDAHTYLGTSSFIQPNGTTAVGKTGNGYARITYLGE